MLLEIGGHRVGQLSMVGKPFSLACNVLAELIFLDLGPFGCYECVSDSGPMYSFMVSEPSNHSLLRGSPTALDDPLYYLKNFCWVLEWVHSRYRDLLDDTERRFLAEFRALPVASQGLLVRMVMRKGQVFRGDKLKYPELGCTSEAVAPLVQLGWVTPAPALDVETLFSVFTWPELRQILATLLGELGLKAGRKSDALSVLTALNFEPATPAEWGAFGVQIYELTLMSLCERFRVMFFGNSHQDWSEFVLTELGRFQYEQVEFSDQCRPFHSRAEIDAYLQLCSCRESFHCEEPLDEIVAAIPSLPSSNPWLIRSRDRLQFQIAREWERAGELGRAAELYLQCGHPEARSRLMRVLELAGEYELALAVAHQAQSAPETEAERQHLARIVPRLERKLGLPCTPKTSAPQSLKEQTEQQHLALPSADSVELAVAQHLQCPDGPVYYVENCLMSGLLGLLCWDAVFAPLPGAFFHPFQSGPADLYWPDFYKRRAQLFETCFEQLEKGDYHARIMANFSRKQGLQSPFVHWPALSEDLLEHALTCIPTRHLKLIFERLLLDIKANAAGLPDLIQFWPAQRQYRMIEVKGPGDRVQDNQRRWLNFFDSHQIPVAVCYVRWDNETADPDRANKK